MQRGILWSDQADLTIGVLQPIGLQDRLPLNRHAESESSDRQQQQLEPRDQSDRGPVVLGAAE